MSDVEVETTAAPQEMDLNTALKEVLKKSLIHDGLARGLNECAKALDARRAHLCLLAEDCDQGEYTKLIEALCSEHSISLLKVSSREQLGEWAGLCQYDAEGDVKKAMKCSCVVVKDYGEESPALEMVLSAVKNQ